MCFCSRRNRDAIADANITRHVGNDFVFDAGVFARYGRIDLQTEDDIARGYKDVSARYRVSCNDRGGYGLRIAPRSRIAQYVEIYGLGANVVLRDTAIEIAQPRATFVQNFTLEFRLVLNPSTAPGTVALPLQLAAVPI